MAVPAKMTSSIFWLRTALGALRSEHPRDRVDHVRLARPVRPDDDRDTRLQLEGGGVGERLESFEGERLQEHSASDPSVRASAIRASPSEQRFRAGSFSETGKNPAWKASRVSVGRRGQKQVERPPLTMRRMVALPQVRQRLAGSVVDAVVELEGAAVAHHVDVLGVAERAAAGLDGLAEDAQDALVEPSDLPRRQGVGQAQRADLRPGAGSRRRRCCRSRRSRAGRGSAPSSAATWPARCA